MNLTWLYVGLVYAIAVRVGRRIGCAIPTHVALVFYLLVLGFMVKPMTGEYTTTHTDMLYHLEPWSRVAPGRLTLLEELNDIPMQIVPWAQQVREQWLAGRI